MVRGGCARWGPMCCRRRCGRSREGAFWRFTHSLRSARFAGAGANCRWRTQCAQRCSLAVAHISFGALGALSVVRWHWRTLCLAHSVHSALFAGTGAHLVWRTQCTQRCSLALAHVWCGALSALRVVRWHWRTFVLAQSVHSALFAGTGADCRCRPPAPTFARVFLALGALRSSWVSMCAGHPVGAHPPLQGRAAKT